MAPKPRNLQWLLDHPDELCREFDDLTDAEVRRLIKLRDRSRAKEGFQAGAQPSAEEKPPSP